MVAASPEPADTRLIEVLQQRDGVLTIVHLDDGTHHVVNDIAWGYDLGDAYAHLTTNVSPGGDGLPVAFFCSDAITGLSDALTGETISIQPA